MNVWELENDLGHIFSVCATGTNANNKQGDLFERFIKLLMQAEGYAVLQNVRTLGSENDLVCERIVNRSRCVVECKSSRETLPAHTITRLLGVAMINNIPEARLYCVGEHSRESKGLVDANRRKELDTPTIDLSVYEPELTIKKSIELGVVDDPKKLQTALFGRVVSENAILILSEKGEFWGFPVPYHGTTRMCFLCEAKPGGEPKLIVSEALLAWLEEVNSRPNLHFEGAARYLEDLVNDSLPSDVAIVNTHSMSSEKHHTNPGSRLNTMLIRSQNLSPVPICDQ